MSTKLQAYICQECQQLFQDPENLQILCSDFAIYNKQNHTLSLVRKRSALREKAHLGCLLCRRLVNYFKLDTDHWDGTQLSRPGGDQNDIVFAVCLVEMAPLVLSTIRQHDISKAGLRTMTLAVIKALLSQNSGWEELFPFNSSTDVRLSASDGSAGKYACLSYCWGTEGHSLQLNRSNLVALHEKIPLELLSRSIQDAIHVTRKLGINYLWVDALCIIQDAADDKEREIQRMDQIYINACLTVAAANSDDCSRGFLAIHERWWSDAEGPPIRLPFLCPDWTVGSITLVKFGHPDFQEPLHRRSWPFQEYLLSPRVLFYGSEQLLWVCHEDAPTSIGATYKIGGPAHDASEMGLKYMRMFLHRPKTISPGFARRNLWIDLVIEYSSRQHTIPNDKIHALRAIATRYQRYMGDEYIAGLWKSWLIPGLLWKSLEPDRPRRERQYPSWSWLSAEGSVKMEKADDPLYRAEHVIDLRFVEYSLNALGDTTDPFGLLPHATLHLRARLKKQDLAMKELFDNGAEKGRANFLRPQPTQIILDSSYEPFSDKESSWFLPLIRVQIADQQTDTYVGHAVQGLLLKQKPNTRIFSRVGWFISGIGVENDFMTDQAQDVFLI
ncbi:MAG: hypothetical protein Q9170_003453 [Blastenia crenularia]